MKKNKELKLKNNNLSNYYKNIRDCNLKLKIKKVKKDKFLRKSNH